MLISPETAPELLEVSPKTVIRMAKQGDLAWCRVGRQIRIRRDSLTQLIDDIRSEDWIRFKGRLMRVALPSKSMRRAVQRLTLEDVSPPVTRSEILNLHTPPWADKDKIKAIYRRAHNKTRRRVIRHGCRKGKPEKVYTVDHIIPLKGRRVCGLHVENNLQIMLREDNIAKSNKFDV